MYRISCLLLTLTALGLGQDGLPVYVSFEFKNPAISNQFSPAKVKQLEQQISKSLAEACGNKLEYWSFQPGGPGQFPKLEVRLNHHSDTSITMSLFPREGSPASSSWTAILLAPGEDTRRGDPAEQRWPALIKAAFEERMLVVQKDQIFAEFRKSVPLGKLEVATENPPSTPEKARAVLPLRWDRYGALALSTFRIDYVDAAEGRVKIHSKGIGLPSVFRGAEPFCGIVVRHMKYEAAGPPEDISRHLASIGRLRSGAFYLQGVEDPGELPVCPR